MILLDLQEANKSEWDDGDYLLVGFFIIFDYDVIYDEISSRQFVAVSFSWRFMIRNQRLICLVVQSDCHPTLIRLLRSADHPLNYYTQRIITLTLG